MEGRGKSRRRSPYRVWKRRGSALLAVLLYKTKFGKNLHAVGQKREAAKYAGISAPATLIATFTLAGAIAGFAGVLCGAYIGGAFQDMGTSYFLPAVAAALVGGTLAYLTASDSPLTSMPK